MFTRPPVTFDHHETMQRTCDALRTSSTEIGLATMVPSAEVPIETSIDALLSRSSSVTDVALPDFVHMKSVKWPSALVFAREEMQSHCSIVVLETISRVAMIIDNKVYLWNYITGGDFKVLEDSDDFIVNITVVKPRKGVFKPYITHLLFLSTRSKLTMYGISFPSDESPHFAPCTILPLDFTVRVNAPLLKLSQHIPSARLFAAGGDGDLYEVIYNTDESLSTPNLRMVNLTMWFGQGNMIAKSVGQVMTSLIKTVRGQAKIVDIMVDSNRDFIYVLQSDSTLSVYTLGRDGNQPVRRYASSQHNAKSLKKFVQQDCVEVFPLVSLHAASRNESYLFFALATNGDRFFYAISDDYDVGGGGKLTVRDVVKFQMPVRRKQMQSILDRQVSSCYYSKNVTVLIRSVTDGDEQATRHASDDICFLTHSRVIMPNESNDFIGRLRPTITFMSEKNGMHDSKVIAVSEIPRELLSPLGAVDLPTPISSSDLVSQVYLPSRRFLVVTRSGVTFVNRTRPIDLLCVILNSDPRQSNQTLQAFRNEYGKDEYCCMLLQLIGSNASEWTGNKISGTLTAESPVPSRVGMSPNPHSATPRRLVYPQSPIGHGGAIVVATSDLEAATTGSAGVTDVSRKAMELMQPFLTAQMPTHIPATNNANNGGGLGFGGGAEVKRMKLPTSDLLRGCRLMVSRLLAPLLQVRIFRVDGTKNQKVEGTMFTLPQLEALSSKIASAARVFDWLRREGLMDVMNVRTFDWESIETDEAIFRSPAGITMTKADVNNIQAVQLQCLDTIVTNTSQLINLLRILHSYNLSELFQKGNTEAAKRALQQIMMPTFENVLFGGHKSTQEFARNLMRCVVKLGATGRSDFNNLCIQLEKECYNIFGEVDIAEYRAQLALEDALNVSQRTKSAVDVDKVLSSLLRIAKHLHLSNGLTGVCQRLAELGSAYAVAALCVQAAHDIDASSLALQAYLHRVSPGKVSNPTPQSQDLLQQRWECYNQMSRVFEEFLNDPAKVVKVEEVLGAHGKKRGEVWNCTGCDELAQYFLFEWMLNHNHRESIRDSFANAVVELSSVYVERFLEYRRNTFGRELALLHTKNRRYDLAMKAYIAAVEAPFETGNALDHRLRILKEALTLEAVTHDTELIGKVKKKYYLAEIQKDLLAVVDRFESTASADVLNFSQIEDGNKKYTARERVAEDRHRLTSSLVQGYEELFKIAEIYKTCGGALIKLRIAYYSTILTVPENQKAICALTEEALFYGESLEITAQVIIDKFYDPTEARFFPMCMLISVLETAAFTAKPNGDDWTIRVFQHTGKVTPQALFREYVRLFDVHYLSTKSVSGDEARTLVSSKFSVVPRSFVLHSMCKLVNHWLSFRGLADQSRTHIPLAQSDCQRFIDQCMQDGTDPLLQECQQILRSSSFNNNSMQNRFAQFRT